MTGSEVYGVKPASACRVDSRPIKLIRHRVYRTTLAVCAAVAFGYGDARTAYERFMAVGCRNLIKASVRTYAVELILIGDTHGHHRHIGRAKGGALERLIVYRAILKTLEALLIKLSVHSAVLRLGRLHGAKRIVVQVFGTHQFPRLSIILIQGLKHDAILSPAQVE